MFPPNAKNAPADTPARIGRQIDLTGKRNDPINAAMATIQAIALKASYESMAIAIVVISPAVKTIKIAVAKKAPSRLIRLK